MPSTPLETVIAHLRSLAIRSTAAMLLPAEKRMPEMRAIADEYFHADPGILELQAEPQRVTLAGRACEWLTTADSNPDRRLLYIHGGSWMKGGLDSHRTLAARIAKVSGCSVLTLDYRLAPENPFPAGLEDCVAVYREMCRRSPSDAGLSDAGASESRAATRTWIAGDSAGGNLTLAALLALKHRGLPLPDGAIALSPGTDFTGSGQSIVSRAMADPILNPAAIPICAELYLQRRCELKHPLASPLFGDLAGLPGLLLQVGDAEILLDDSVRFADAARAAGVDVSLSIWPRMPHVFQGFAPLLPEALQAIDEMGNFIRGSA